MKITIDGQIPDGVNVTIEDILFDTYKEVAEFIQEVNDIKNQIWRTRK